MISFGFILMGFGITIPAVYWVVASFFIFIDVVLAVINATINHTTTTINEKFSGFKTLFIVIFLDLLFPIFTLTWWMWLYFSLLGLLSVIAIIK